MTGIYLHIPFCVRKCFYCDFYSETNLAGLNSFTELICREIKIRSDAFPEKKEIDTVFFGGGTPSLLSEANLGKIFESLHKAFTIKMDAEITLECNPGTAIKERLIQYRNLGVNRLSIGVQSFVDDELKFLQRIHDSSEAIETFHNAREAGFKNISLDLIFAIPMQTMDSLKYSIDKAIRLAPENISYYSLIYEPDTPLYKEYLFGIIRKIDEEVDANQYELIIDSLKKAGYGQYEVSNFAKPGKECLHNLIYWHGHEYFGFGPSAHGYLDNVRYWNVKNFRKYYNHLKINTLPGTGSETLTAKNRFEEQIYLGLRADGIDLDRLQNDFGGNTKEKLETELKQFIEEGLVTSKKSKYSLTKRGYMVCDYLAIKLLKNIDDIEFITE